MYGYLVEENRKKEKCVLIEAAVEVLSLSISCKNALLYAHANIIFK